MFLRIVSLIRGFLARFFARRSPIGFDQEIGSWLDPDVVLNDAASQARPLVNNDCKKVHIVYAVELNLVPQCTFIELATALGQAYSKAATYFDRQFRCENPNCIRKTGELIWAGVSCGTNPTTATGAVLVRFRCEVEF